ncbi:MAG TPA: tetratricopeptide repeat protein [Coleofasciculaceae cyanobacterium]|jgi:tetratricopeptide (TPR) repeat protein
MKKLLGLALVPAMLAVSPMLALAEQTAHPAHPAAQGAQSWSSKTSQSQMQSQYTGVQKGQQQQAWQQSATKGGSQWAAMNPQIARQLLMGQEQLVGRHFPEAITAFQAVVSADQNNVRALEGLSIALYSQGRFDEALQTVNRAIALDPVNGRLFFTKAQILDTQDQAMEAVESYLTFTALNPEDTSAYAALRRVDELQKWIQPQLTTAWQSYFQGLRFLSLRQADQAIPMFEKFQTMEPNNEKAALFIGRSYLSMGMPEKAIPFFKTSLKLQSDNPVAYYQLGSSYDLSGETQQARDAWRKFLQFAPQSESAMLINRRFEVGHQ